MYFIARAFLIFGVFSCSDTNKEPTQIYPLTSLTHQSMTENGYGEKFSLMFEYFVVYHPSDDKKSLVKFIEAYNQNRLSRHDLRETETRISRFYKQTDNLTKNYKASATGWPEPDDTISLHNDALLLVVKWTEYGQSVEIEMVGKQ